MLKNMQMLKNDNKERYIKTTTTKDYSSILPFDYFSMDFYRVGT